MKNYNRLLGLSLILYLVTAVVSGYLILKEKNEYKKYYNVEINRIYDSLLKEGAFDKLPLRLDDTYKYVVYVEYLSASKTEDDKIASFFEEDNEHQMKIMPWYEQGVLDGYLRFDYKNPEYVTSRTLLIVQAGLLCLELSSVLFLIYIKKRIINPFHRLSELPYDIAKGHLKGELKEEKNKYFGKFIWGMSQLKKTLYITKKRELELEKEKKQLLLSLSHDIKTPLHTIGLYEKALEENLYKEESQKRHALRQISKKVKEIEKYVGEIIETAKEDIVDIQVEKGEFYLKELMEQALDIYVEQCEIRRLDLQIGTYKNKLLKGDIHRAREVFENLFENALKYGDGRKIEITFYEEEYCQLIRIFNTGDTITENEHNHIFESFFRGGNSKGKQGSGLGLYIAREIMRKMGGDIFCERTEDGMVFVLVFL